MSSFPPEGPFHALSLSGERKLESGAHMSPIIEDPEHHPGFAIILLIAPLLELQPSV